MFRKIASAVTGPSPAGRLKFVAAAKQTTNRLFGKVASYGIGRLLRGLFLATAREDTERPQPALAGLARTPIIENELPIAVRPRWSRSGPMTRAELYEYFKARGELATFFRLFPPTQG